jgi:hypothetical protein
MNMLNFLLGFFISRIDKNNKSLNILLLQQIFHIQINIVTFRAHLSTWWLLWRPPSAIAYNIFIKDVNMSLFRNF